MTDTERRERFLKHVLELLAPANLWGDEKFCLFDVGASGGIDGMWRIFADRLTGCGFDPSVSGCEKLNAIEENEPGDFQYKPCMVTAPAGAIRSDTMPYHRLAAEHKLNVQDRQMEDYFNQFDENTEYVEGFDYLKAKKTSLASRSLTLPDPQLQPAAGDDLTLDALASGTNVDFLKIDTDGSDFPILMGAERLLWDSPVLGVMIESNFQGGTDDRSNTFANIDIFLRRRGFSLFDMKGPFRYARACFPDKFLEAFPSQSEKGQIIWCDAIYLRDVCMPDYFGVFRIDMDTVKLLKLVILAFLFDQHDFAIEVLIDYKNVFPDAVDLKRIIDLTTEHNYGVKSYDDYIKEFYKS